MVRVELINPNNPTNAANVPFLQKGLFFSWKAKAYSPPLNLCMIAAYTPEDIEVSIADECVKPIDFNNNVDLVGLTAYTNSAPRAYQIADAFRRRNVPVVMGGIHASTLHEEALEHCDSVVVGEAEGAWQRVIRDFQNGHLKKLYQNDQLVSLADLPKPRRDLLNPEDYVTINTVQTTRGCPHNCSFCSVTRFNGRTYRFRPIHEVVEEIESLPSRNVFIIDDNIFSNRERTKALFEALVPLGIRWGSQCTISIARDPEMLELAARSGCIGMAIGLESFSRESLEGAHKRFNDPDRFYQDIAVIKSYGIFIWGSFVLGFDEDDEAGLEKTIAMARSSKLDFACFNFLTPLPGTAIYDRFKREDRLESENWAEYNMANLVFRPIKVTGELLGQQVRKAWLEFYALKALFHRLGLSVGKIRIFVWLVNLALCFYTRKKLLRTF
ncbi:MAG: B12-binding domain-containing radical SAM protein [Thermodesulfobacteriota bacterium]